MNEEARTNCPKAGNTVWIPLAPVEEDILRRFAETPFLPVASDGNFPVCLEFDIPSPQAGNTLQKLEKRGLIRIDYEIPLEGFDYIGYENYAMRGSMALTALGQEQLDDMDIEG